MSVTVSLPDDLVQSLAGLAGSKLEEGASEQRVGEFVEQHLREDVARRQEDQKRLEEFLLEGLKGEPIPVNEAFWSSLRKRVAEKVGEDAP